MQFPLLLYLALAVSCPTSHTGSSDRGSLSAPPQSSPEDTPQMSSTGDSGEQIDDFLIGTGDTCLVLNTKRAKRSEATISVAGVTTQMQPTVFLHIFSVYILRDFFLS